ncbi:MAG: hypothetical protein ACRCTZ_11435 [Sarcina sp.]
MMTKKEILNLLEEDLNNESIPVLDLEIINYREAEKVIGCIEIRICNLSRIEDNIASDLKSRLEYFEKEMKIKIIKKVLVL